MREAKLILDDGSQFCGWSFGYDADTTGEVVLNKSQQATLAQNLQGGGGNLKVTGVLQGRTLLMVVENELKSQGKGEIATWKS
jgi:hypothetical protein